MSRKLMKAEDQPAQSAVFGILNMLLVITIAMLANYLAYRHYQRFDWTQAGIHTLSEGTLQVLGGLDEPVDLYVLLSESEPEFGAVRTLASLYEAASDRLEVHYIDPYRDRQSFDELIGRFGIGTAVDYDLQMEVADVAAIVASGERHWEIERNDLVRARFDQASDGEGYEVTPDSEEALTGALVELSTGEPTRLCFVTGHGELSVDEDDVEGALRSLRDQLRRQNLTIETIESRGAREVPDRCHGVAVLGPEGAWEASEVALLRTYLRGGGNVLLALDPGLTSALEPIRPTGFEAMLRDFGVRVDRAVAVEPDDAMLPGDGSPISLFLVRNFGEHPITEILSEGSPLAVAEARPVRPAADGGAVDVLLSTSDVGYGETDPRTFREAEELRASPDDVPGPVSLAVATRVEVLGDEPPDPDALEPEEADGSGGRLVVLGDSTLFASELHGNPALANRFFASALINWLTAREARVSIPPRSVELEPVVITEGSVLDIAWRVVLAIPLAFLLLAFGVWWMRRS